MRDNKRIWNPY